MTGDNQQGLRGYPAGVRVPSTEVLGGGFKMPPHESRGALDAQTLVAVANEQIKRGTSTHVTSGPNVYHHVMPSPSDAPAAPLRTSLGSPHSPGSTGSPRTDRSMGPDMRMPWGAGPGLQRWHQKPRPSSPTAYSAEQVQVYPATVQPPPGYLQPPPTERADGGYLVGMPKYEVLTGAQVAALQARGELAAFPVASQARGQAGASTGAQTPPPGAHTVVSILPSQLSAPPGSKSAPSSGQEQASSGAAAAPVAPAAAAATAAAVAVAAAPAMQEAAAVGAAAAAAAAASAVQPAGSPVLPSATAMAVQMAARSSAALAGDAAQVLHLQTPPASAPAAGGGEFSFGTASGGRTEPAGHTLLPTGNTPPAGNIATGNSAQAAAPPQHAPAYGAPPEPPPPQPPYPAQPAQAHMPHPATSLTTTTTTTTSPSLPPAPASMRHGHPQVPGNHPLSGATPFIAVPATTAQPASYVWPPNQPHQAGQPYQPHHPHQSYQANQQVSHSQAWSAASSGDVHHHGFKGPWGGQYQYASPRSSMGSPRSPKQPVMHALPSRARMAHASMDGGVQQWGAHGSMAGCVHQGNMPGGVQQWGSQPSSVHSSGNYPGSFQPPVQCATPRLAPTSGGTSDIHEAGRAPNQALSATGTAGGGGVPRQATSAAAAGSGGGGAAPRVWEGSSHLESDPAYTRYSNSTWSKGALSGAVVDPASPGLHPGQVYQPFAAQAPTQYPSSSSSHRPYSANPHAAGPASYERRLKRQLWGDRQGLAQDVRMQQASARFARAENRRLERHAQALAATVEGLLLSGRGLGALGVQLEAGALDARGQWLDTYLPLTTDGVLAPYTYRAVPSHPHNPGQQPTPPKLGHYAATTLDGGDRTLDTLLSLLQAVKGDRNAAAAEQQQQRLGGERQHVAAGRDGDQHRGADVSHPYDPYMDPEYLGTLLEAGYELNPGRRYLLDGHPDGIPWTAVELLRAELAGEMAGQAADKAAAARAAAAPAAAAVPAAPAAAVAAAPAAPAAATGAAIPAAGAGPPAGASAAGAGKGSQPGTVDRFAAVADVGADKSKVTASSKVDGAPSKVVKPSKQDQEEVSDQDSDSSGGSTRSSTSSEAPVRTPAAAGAGATPAAIAPPLHLEVLVVPYSKMSPAPKLDAALAQVLRPPRAGDVAAIYTTARHPLPRFEGVPERTRLRQTWGSGAKGNQRSKVLRDAEEVMAERKAEEDELEEAIEAGEAEGLTEAEVLAEQAEEEAEESKAIQRSALRASHDRESNKEEEAALRASNATFLEKKRAETDLIDEFREGQAKDEEEAEAEEREEEEEEAKAQKAGSPRSAIGTGGVQGVTTAALQAGATGTTGATTSASPAATTSGAQPAVFADGTKQQQEIKAAGEGQGPGRDAQASLGPRELNGTYSLGPGGLENTSATFRQIAYGRTVRDRLLQLELEAAHLSARGLDRVVPEGWAAADKLLAEHADILEDIIDKEHEELEVAAEVAERDAQEDAEEAALEAKAYNKARAAAAKEAAALPDDDNDPPRDAAGKGRGGRPTSATKKAEKPKEKEKVSDDEDDGDDGGRRGSVPGGDKRSSAPDKPAGTDKPVRRDQATTRGNSNDDDGDDDGGKRGSVPVKPAGRDSPAGRDKNTMRGKTNDDDDDRDSDDGEESKGKAAGRQGQRPGSP